jgi:arylsulfatase A-like enzyme
LRLVSVLKRALWFSLAPLLPLQIAWSAAFQATHLSDRLASAVVEAPEASGSAAAAEPVVWQNFFSSSDITWQLIRGRIGVRNGDLIVKGEGSTPVIASPKETSIDWTLYQAVELRMSAQAGSEVKIKIGGFESTQKLGPPGQYNIYRFPVDGVPPQSGIPLGVMPTDSLDALAAIRSIKLIPKDAPFPKNAGRAFLGRQDVYREVVYVHSPSVITFAVSVPPGGHLHFGMGLAAKNSAVKFRVTVEGDSADLYTKTMDGSSGWEDGHVDLSRWGGRTIKLQLRTEAPQAGAIGLWANPVIAGPEPGGGRPNVVIYTIDTLRADHASLYGYARDTTPFLKKLGASGVVFDDCQSQSPWTKPSIASLMTSLYSFTHAIVGDADTIPPGSVTLAEQLRAAGYVTASIVASPFVGRATGLERGFDYLYESPVVLRAHNRQTEGDTDSAALNRVVFPWLDRHYKEPFFLYAHSTDPHAPYGPPPPYDGQFANPSETAAFNRNYKRFVTEREHGGAAVFNREMCRKASVDPDRFLQQAVGRYDGEIRNNDANFERFVEKLRQLGVLDNTLIIVLSDHGEEFWDHGWTGHGQSVYQELAHSFLLMWNPALLPRARRVAEPVQLIDVMPTILDLLGLKTPELVEGQSLMPLARGQSFQRRGLVVSSRLAGVHPVGPVPENAADSFAIINAKWKFIYRKNAAKAGVNKVELYDRASDRTERRDVADRYPREVERMVGELAQWIDAQNKIRDVVGHAGTTTLDRKTLEQMRSLGYLGGSSQ